MVKVSANRYVMLRIEAIRRETEAHTQKLRRKLLKNLEEIFQQASKNRERRNQTSKNQRKND